MHRIIACLAVENRSIPKSFRRKTTNTRNLQDLWDECDRRDADRPDPREVSIKFDNAGNITEATSERLEAFQHYSNCVDANTEIEYLEDERKLNAYLIAFAKLAGM